MTDRRRNVRYNGDRNEYYTPRVQNRDGPWTRRTVARRDDYPPTGNSVRRNQQFTTDGATRNYNSLRSPERNSVFRGQNRANNSVSMAGAETVHLSRFRPSFEPRSPFTRSRASFQDFHHSNNPNYGHENRRSLNNQLNTTERIIFPPLRFINSRRLDANAEQNAVFNSEIRNVDHRPDTRDILEATVPRNPENILDINLNYVTERLQSLQVNSPSDLQTQSAAQNEIQNLNTERSNQSSNKTINQKRCKCCNRPITKRKDEINMNLKNNSRSVDNKQRELNPSDQCKLKSLRCKSCDRPIIRKGKAPPKPQVNRTPFKVCRCCHRLMTADNVPLDNRKNINVESSITTETETLTNREIPASLRPEYEQNINEVSSPIKETKTSTNPESLATFGLEDGENIKKDSSPIKETSTNPESPATLELEDGENINEDSSPIKETSTIRESPATLGLEDGENIKKDSSPTKETSMNRESPATLGLEDGENIKKDSSPIKETSTNPESPAILGLEDGENIKKDSSPIKETSTNPESPAILGLEDGENIKKDSSPIKETSTNPESPATLELEDGENINKDSSPIKETKTSTNRETPATLGLEDGENINEDSSPIKETSTIRESPATLELEDGENIKKDSSPITDSTEQETANIENATDEDDWISLLSDNDEEGKIVIKRR
ncbi:hypothetical protein ACOME3_001127 [Neoechinorhynchus agilis]